MKLFAKSLMIFHQKPPDFRKDMDKRNLYYIRCSGKGKLPITHSLTVWKRKSLKSLYVKASIGLLVWICFPVNFH